MKVRLRGKNGNWIDPAFEDWHADPPLDLRGAAMEAIRRQLGIRYLVMDHSSWHADAFRASAPAWGLQKLLETRNWTLYRID